MMKSKIKISIPNWSKVVSVIFFLLLLGAYTQIFATAWPYEPGTTLDPECGPEITDCTVSMGGGSSVWQSNVNGIHYTDGLVGIGTETPNASLSLNGFLSFGVELVSNGSFTGNADGWNLYDGGTYSNDSVTVNYTGVEDPYLSTSVELEAGKEYLLSFTLSEEVNDTVLFYFDNNSFYNNLNYENGTYNIIITTDYTGTDTLIFSNWGWTENSSWAIDNISLKEITQKTPAFQVLNIKGTPVFSLGTEDDSKFVYGQDAGVNSIGAKNSIFIGEGSGYGSADSTNSVFLGTRSGNNSEGVSSVFLGIDSGKNAITNSSVFIGTQAGMGVTSANYSNFIGKSSGQGALSAMNSNFLGERAGYNATNSHDSNFLGRYAGAEASGASYSNFLGGDAGYMATNAYRSNFFGLSAGRGATNASFSNFFGTSSGYNSSNAAYSVFVGNRSGENATNASNSIFIGNQAGSSDTVNNTASQNNWSILIGYNIKTGGYKNSILMGGSLVVSPVPQNTKENQFMLVPSITDMRLRGIDYNLPSAQGTSNTVLTNNGGGGLSWSSAPVSVVSSTNLFSGGLNAGQGVTTTTRSIFLGSSTGYNASNASNSNFIGYQAGYSALNASNSNLIGNVAGSGANQASYSNFIGYQSGQNATNAANSIFIGSKAGNGDMVNNTATWNDTTTFANTSILIGHNTNTGGFINSISLGAYAQNTATNQFMIGSTTRPINTTVWKGASTTATLDTATGLITTSDERLKTNVNDLDNTILEKLLNVRTVTFNWKEGDNDKLNIGFLAQDLEKYFPQLVYTGTDDYKGVNYANMTPILTEAIRELNLKVEKLESESHNWLSSLTSNITEFVTGILRAKEKLCIGEGSEEVCITKEELLEMKKNAGLYSEPVLEEPIAEEKEAEELEGEEEVVVEEPAVEEESDLEEEPKAEEETPEEPEVPEVQEPKPIVEEEKEPETPPEEVEEEEDVPENPVVL